MKKRLQLSRSNKILAGVCGGVAEYLNVDATLIRILTVIIGLVTTGVPVAVLYVVCWAVMPLEAE